MSDPTQAKADIVGFSNEYSSTVRSWMESEETYRNVCQGQQYPPPDNIVESWQRSNVVSYLLFTDNRPVAYAELWNRPQEMAVEIAHLLVDPFQRSKGFGTKMLQLLYDRASQRRDVSQVLANLQTEDEDVLSCFLNAGFELVGTSPHTLGLRVIRFVK